MRPTPPPEPLHWQVWALYALALLLGGMVVYGLVAGETPGRHPFTREDDPERFWQSLTLLFVLACAAFGGARWLNRR